MVEFGSHGCTAAVIADGEGHRHWVRAVTPTIYTPESIVLLILRWQEAIDVTAPATQPTCSEETARVARTTVGL